MRHPRLHQSSSGPNYCRLRLLLFWLLLEAEDFRSRLRDARGVSPTGFSSSVECMCHAASKPGKTERMLGLEMRLERMRVKIAADAPMHLIANKLGEAAQANTESEASESERDLARASTITLSIEEDRLGRLGRSNGRGWERLSCGCLALCHFHVVRRRRRRYRVTAEARVHFLGASVGPTDERPSVNRQSVM